MENQPHQQLREVEIDGKRYQLVPISESSAPVVSELPAVVPVDPLDEFLVNNNTPPSATVVSTPAQVSIEESPHGVQSATPKPYDYAARLRDHLLVPSDVMVRAPDRRVATAKFSDLSVFEEDKRLPEKKQLFYGPGIEQDLAY